MEEGWGCEAGMRGLARTEVCVPAAPGAAARRAPFSSSEERGDGLWFPAELPRDRIVLCFYE